MTVQTTDKAPRREFQIKAEGATTAEVIAAFQEKLNAMMRTDGVKTARVTISGVFQGDAE